MRETDRSPWQAAADPVTAEVVLPDFDVFANDIATWLFEKTARTVAG